jgi:hypothetical protein
MSRSIDPPSLPALRIPPAVFELLSSASSGVAQNTQNGFAVIPRYSDQRHHIQLHGTESHRVPSLVSSPLNSPSRREYEGGHISHGPSMPSLPPRSPGAGSGSDYAADTESNASRSGLIGRYVRRAPTPQSRKGTMRRSMTPSPFSPQQGIRRVPSSYCSDVGVSESRYTFKARSKRLRELPCPGLDVPSRRSSPFLRTQGLCKVRRCWLPDSLDF